MDPLAAFRTEVERTRHFSVEARRAAYVLLFERLADPVIDEAKQAGDLGAVLAILEEARRIGYEAGVFDRPPPAASTH